MTTPHEPPLSRRAARLAQQAAAAGGDRVAHSVGSAAHVDEAIDYRTAVRPRLPFGDSEALASIDSVSSLPASAPLAPPFAPPTAPAPGGGVRSRDFRPPSEHGASRPLSFSPPPADAPLEYQTMAGSPVSSAAHSAPSAASSPEPEPEPEPADGRFESHDDVEHEHVMPELVMPEHTMTRRELRALRATREAQEPPAVELVPESESAVGLEAFDALLSGASNAAADDHAVHSVGTTVVEGTADSAATEPAPAQVWEPATVERSAPAPLVEPEQLPAADVAQPAPSPQTGSHWSAGFTEPDEDPFENTFSRQVGEATASTNALVLPEMPIGSLAGPVPGTGEIIITGMVDVPSSIASTGAVPSVHDSPDLDDLVDAGDHEFVSSDSAPVSAINAVSGHTATRDVIGGRHPRGNTLTTVLIVSTIVMAIAAVTIFVIAAMNGLF